MNRAGLAASLAVLAAAALHAADDVPSWVREAAAQTVPSYSAKVNTVTLLHEQSVSIDAEGKFVIRERGVVKILQSGGKSVTAYHGYDAKSGRIRDFRAWLIPASGKPTAFGKNRVIDFAAAPNFILYDDSRAKAIDSGSTEAGSVFAWEVTEEEKTLLMQDEYRFQSQSPALVSRFVATLPAGWEIRGIVFNHAAVEPQVNGTTYTWELKGLPWIEPEDYSPSMDALVPRLVVSYFPPTDNRAGLQGLKDWTSVSTWLSTLVDPSAEATDAIRAKAAQLTANAPGELDKIRAIAAFAQQTTYVAVALNLNRGGGYTPHRADETMSKNYGDCKDKATLMRALLKAVGIEGYLTTISADDRTYVRREWASPTQFNHAIIAIEVSDAVQLPTVISGTPLGSLLIFDPTDSITQVGDLPEDEQGSYALVVAGARGVLLKMPLLPATANRIESRVEATMNVNGQLQARLERQYFGQSGAQVRAIEKMRGNDELKKRFERGFSRRLGGTTLTNLAMHAEGNPLGVSLDLAAERFGQLMQGRLLIVRPGSLTSGSDYFFTSKQRSSPVKLEADIRHDSIKVKLPAGFKLDELPAPAKIESSYGTLEASWAVRDGEIVMEQTLEIRGTVAPPSEYAQLRDFFDRVAGAQAAPVVLLKQ
jgi:hypothetical protein